MARFLIGFAIGSLIATLIVANAPVKSNFDELVDKVLEQVRQCPNLSSVALPINLTLNYPKENVTLTPITINDCHLLELNSVSRNGSIEGQKKDGVINLKGATSLKPLSLNCKVNFQFKKPGKKQRDAGWTLNGVLNRSAGFRFDFDFVNETRKLIVNTIKVDTLPQFKLTMKYQQDLKEVGEFVLKGTPKPISESIQNFLPTFIQHQFENITIGQKEDSLTSHVTPNILNVEAITKSSLEATTINVATTIKPKSKKLLDKSSDPIANDAPPAVASSTLLGSGDRNDQSSKKPLKVKEESTTNIPVSTKGPTLTNGPTSTIAPIILKVEGIEPAPKKNLKNSTKSSSNEAQVTGSTSFVELTTMIATTIEPILTTAEQVEPVPKKLKNSTEPSSINTKVTESPDLVELTTMIGTTNEPIVLDIEVSTGEAGSGEDLIASHKNETKSSSNSSSVDDLFDDKPVNSSNSSSSSKNTTKSDWMSEKSSSEDFIDGLLGKSNSSNSNSSYDLSDLDLGPKAENSTFDYDFSSNKTDEVAELFEDSEDSPKSHDEKRRRAYKKPRIVNGYPEGFDETGSKIEPTTIKSSPRSPQVLASTVNPVVDDVTDVPENNDEEDLPTTTIKATTTTRSSTTLKTTPKPSTTTKTLNSVLDDLNLVPTDSNDNEDDLTTINTSTAKPSTTTLKPKSTTPSTTTFNPATIDLEDESELVVTSPPEDMKVKSAKIAIKWSKATTKKPVVIYKSTGQPPRQSTFTPTVTPPYENPIQKVHQSTQRPIVISAPDDSIDINAKPKNKNFNHEDGYKSEDQLTTVEQRQQSVNPDSDEPINESPPLSRQESGKKLVNEQLSQEPAEQSVNPVTRPPGRTTTLSTATDVDDYEDNQQLYGDNSKHSPISDLLEHKEGDHSGENWNFREGRKKKPVSTTPVPAEGDRRVHSGFAYEKPAKKPWQENSTSTATPTLTMSKSTTIKVDDESLNLDSDNPSLEQTLLDNGKVKPGRKSPGSPGGKSNDEAEVKEKKEVVDKKGDVKTDKILSSADGIVEDKNFKDEDGDEEESPKKKKRHTSKSRKSKTRDEDD